MLLNTLDVDVSANLAVRNMRYSRLTNIVFHML